MYCEINKLAKKFDSKTAIRACDIFHSKHFVAKHFDGRKEFRLEVVQDSRDTGFYDDHRDCISFFHKENYYDIIWLATVSKNAHCNLCIHLSSLQFIGSNIQSVDTEIELEWLIEGRMEKVENIKHCFDRNDKSSNCIELSTKTKMNYFVRNRVVRIKVKIIKTGRRKMRNFGESDKEFTDVVLIVNDEKFYVLKKHLASHSSYFNSLFFGNFDESKQSEVTLKGIDAWDFHNFLEVIYGEPTIDDDTVEGILELAEMYDAKSVMKNCEWFLIEESIEPLQVKLEIAERYNLDKLKVSCEKKSEECESQSS